jgi:hypothetical protein
VSTPDETIARITQALDDWETLDAARWDPDVADPSPAILVIRYARRYGLDTSEARRHLSDVRVRGEASEYYPQVHAVTEDTMAHLREACGVLQNHVRESWARVKAMMEPLLEWSRTEEGQAQLAEWKREREELERVRPCNCLCQVAHGSLGVCEGKAARTLVRDTETFGRVEIPVCGPCADATLTKQQVAAR